MLYPNVTNSARAAEAGHKALAKKEAIIKAEEEAARIALAEAGKFKISFYVTFYKVIYLELCIVWTNHLTFLGKPVQLP